MPSCIRLFFSCVQTVLTLAELALAELALSLGLGLGLGLG